MERIGPFAGTQDHPAKTAVLRLLLLRSTTQGIVTVKIILRIDLDQRQPKSAVTISPSTIGSLPFAGCWDPLYPGQGEMPDYTLRSRA